MRLGLALSLPPLESAIASIAAIAKINNPQAQLRRMVMATLHLVWGRRFANHMKLI
jgi:hypothetical protein